MPATSGRYAVVYDNEGLIDGKPFAFWFAVIDADTGEAICRCDSAGRGEQPEADAERRANHIADLLNEADANRERP